MTPHSLADLENFVSVSEWLASAGQPSEEELGRIRHAGFEVLVNLGLAGQPYSLKDEAASARALGLSYHHIPVQFTAPTEADYEAFERVMLASEGKHVFVHCALNYRVSCFVALYGERQLGWDRARAETHIRTVWEPNEVWSVFLERVRSMP